MGTVANLVVKITAETAQFNKGLQDMGTAVKGISGILGGIEIGAAFEKMAGAVEHTGELSSHLQDLAEKAGISAEAVQQLDFAARQSGSSFDNISSALAIMSKKLVGGDESAVKALTDMGLTFSAIRAMTPDQAFIAIGDAISKVPDPMRRSADAMLLFGRSGAQLLPVLGSNLKELTEHAREAGLVISNETVKAGDSLNDTLDALHMKSQALVANGLAPMVDVLLQLPVPLQTAGVLAMNMLPTLGQLGLGFAGLAPLLGPAIIAVGGLTTALGLLGIALAGVVAMPFAIKGLTESNKANIDAGVMVGGEGMVMPLDLRPGQTGPQRKGNVDLAPDAMAGMTQMFTVNMDAMNKAYEAQQKYQAGIDALTARLSGGDVINAAKQWTAAVVAIGGAEHLTAEETKQYTDALIAAELKMEAFGKTYSTYARVLAASAEASRTGAQTGAFLGDQLKDLKPFNGTPLLQNTGDPSKLLGAVPGAGVQTQQQSDSALVGALIQGQQLGNQLKAGMASSVASLPNVILSAFQGGGSVVNSIASKLGGDFGGTFSKMVGGGLSKLLGSQLGGAIGGLMGPLGSMLGPLIGQMVTKLGAAVWHGIQGIFGTDEEARVVNPARDAFSAKYKAQYGGSNTEAVIKALEAAGLGGERAANLIAAFNAADTKSKWDAAKNAIEEALGHAKEATKANDTFNVSLTGSDEAIKGLGVTESKVVETMLQGFTQLIAKLDEMISKLAMAGALSAQVAVGSIGVIGAQAGTFTSPGTLIGSAMASNDDLGISRGGPSVTINAGNIIGNPDDVAYMVIDAIESGGDVASDYRAVHNQVVPD